MKELGDELELHLPVPLVMISAGPCHVVHASHILFLPPVLERAASPRVRLREGERERESHESG